MAVAGDLVVNLGLNAKPFSAGLNKAQGGMTSFASSATSLLNPITIAFAAIAASAAATGLSLFGIAQRIESLAAIADKAKQTGLSGEFIQQLGFAADQSGVHVDTLLNGLEKMTITLGKAELHTEETAKAFEQIGLEATVLADLSPEDQFLAIAEAIAKLPSVAEKAAATIAIFGKSTAEMGPLLGEGTKGIRALMAEAKGLKIGISEDDLASIATADDAIQRMKSTLSTVVSNIAVGMAPLFESMSNTITEITPKISEIARAISTGLADAIGKAVTLFNSDLLPGLKEFLTVSGDLLTKWSGMQDKFQFVGDILKAVFDVAIEYIKVYWSIMLDDLIAATAKAAGEMLNMLNPKTGFDAVADWLTGQNAEKLDPKNETAALDAAQGRLSDLIKQLQTGEIPRAAASNAPQGIDAASPPVAAATPGITNASPPVKPPSGWSMSGQQLGGIAGMMSGGVRPVGGKDPNVTATEKQTADLIRGLKPAPLSMVPEF